MEHELCEAAIKGDTDSLVAIIQKDPLILHKFADGCFNGAASPLHVATSNNQTHFVEELLHRQPELTEVLDSQLRSALHLASAKGHDEIVKVLVTANSEMCLVRDLEGKNPLHVAAVKGKINALKELVGARPKAARDRVDQNETILHLCVKHNQWKSLEILLETIQGKEPVKAKDNDGNTILHLAILDQRSEITGHVLENKIIDVNETNASGHTAMDLLLLGSNHKEVDHIEDLLLQANDEQAKDLVGGDWLAKKRDPLMVVAVLIATMAFEAGVNPPGGVWQDDDGHVAGESVMAYHHKSSYPYILWFNTIGFVASLSTILLLISGLGFKNKAAMWFLMVIMWLAITAIATTYAFATFVVTPKTDHRSLGYTIKIGVIVWSGLMSTLLLNHTFNLVTIFVKEKTSKMKAIRRIMGFNPQSLPIVCNFLRVRDGRATPPLFVTKKKKKKMACVREREADV